MTKKGLYLLLLIILQGMFITGHVISQTRTENTGLQGGINLYGAGKWKEAAAELRRFYGETRDTAQRAEALYWIALAELAAGEYEASIRTMDELEGTAPFSQRRQEIPYHRGRSYYYLGRYDEAVVLLKAYSDSIPAGGNAAGNAGIAARKSAALYWIGECLYAMGQLEKAREIFLLITEQYPQSAKFEASSYRIALIDQKKIETELLSLLKWSHEESLKTIEEYQRRERSYDQALVAYQKRIADMLKDSRLADLERANAEYRRLLSAAEERIAFLEAGRKTD
ncbi:MAG: tetratricopeptide repeat protein [Treponema sp.]|jgi:TolA-binding protein|nr:tetratricopeptide repeat protein [Treponema sp.]